MAEPFLLAQGTDPILFNPRMGNRHGLIAGATGTGKTVTLQTLAENFSALGVPVCRIRTARFRNEVCFPKVSNCRFDCLTRNSSSNLS